MVTHQTVKEILMEIASEYGCREARSVEYCIREARSGDSQPLDIRSRRKHATYNPDVYWITSKGKLIIFEVAFHEDQRSIVGELTLASLVPNAWKFFVIVNNESRASKIEEFMSIADEQLLDKRGKRRLRFKSEVIYIPERLKKKKQVKKFFVRKFREGGWI